MNLGTVIKCCPLCGGRIAVHGCMAISWQEGYQDE